MTAPLVRIGIASAAGAALVTLGGCDLGHKQTTQTGYRGAGLDQIVDLKHIAKAERDPGAALSAAARWRPDRGAELSERQGAERGQQGAFSTI